MSIFFLNSGSRAPRTSVTSILDSLVARFTVTVFSDEEGLSKPHAPVFAKAARELGVSPEELLHIGDLEYSDIAGARGVGATAALFAGVSDRFASETKADYTFHSWREFIDILPHL